MTETLDAGERAAIARADKLGADLLLIVRDVVARLRETNFYIDDAVIESVFGRGLT